jgi:hypothetical protein
MYKLNVRMTIARCTVSLPEILDIRGCDCESVGLLGRYTVQSGKCI